MFRAFGNWALSMVYPQACVICGQGVAELRSGPACENCWARSTFFDSSAPRCRKCGDPSAHGYEFGGTDCVQCRDHHYDHASALGIYEHGLAAAVVELKRVPNIPSRLRDKIRSAEFLAAFAADTLVMPVPLSPLRKLERGYNQAAVLADFVARAARLEIDSASLVRKVHSPIHRVAMDEKARDLSVRNAFSVTRPKLIAGRNILLVDDVFTTGSTASYCAKALKKSGAGEVNVFTLARAVKRF